MLGLYCGYIRVIWGLYGGSIGHDTSKPEKGKIGKAGKTMDFQITARENNGNKDSEKQTRMNFKLGA